MAGEWLGQLPGDLQTNEAFTQHATLGDFAKAHLGVAGKLKEFEGKATELGGKVTAHEKTIADLNNKLAKDYIPRLPENASAEETDVFYRGIGKPEKATDYVIPDPEGGKADPKVVTWMQTTAHKHNLTKAQAEGMAREFNVFVSGLLQARGEEHSAAVKKVEDELRKELGSNYDATVKRVGEVWTKIMGADTDIKQFLEGTVTGPIGNDPRFIKFMRKVATMTGNDTLLHGGPSPGSADGKSRLVYPSMQKK